MTLDIRLDPIEARLFGVLIEKALTTPDQYPLTVNSATNGANQKSNRDPILSLSEDEVEAALARLEQKYMARKVFPMNSRVEKYCHNGKDALALDAPALAVLAELLMRGPQTPGDLRGRAGRMAPIESLDQLTAILSILMERDFVRRLPAVPGGRAERYMQLLSPDLHPIAPESDRAASVAAMGRTSATPEGQELQGRVAALESEVQSLRDQVRAIAERLGMA